MKIGLNATCFNDRPSGAKQRFVGIFSELFKQLPEVDFVLYEPLDCHVGGWFEGASNVSVRQTPLPSVGRIKKFYRGFGYWKKALRSESYQIFEGFSIPLIKPPSGRTMVTIHDMRRMQSVASRFDRLLFNTVVGRAFEASDHVIAVSEAMKKEILGFYPGITASVIYNGIDAEGFGNVSEEDRQTVSRKLGLPDEFILAIGHFEQRKNYLRLIDALALLRDQGRAPNLVIVGNDSGERKAIEARVCAANLSGQVKIFSGLSDLEVRCLYKLCSLFVFPSSYEGFGIPILESMASGCPMVLSDIPVFREITQDQGFYFPHDDPEAMAFAIEQVLGSSEERERLVSYGNMRVSDFSFQNIAESYAFLYKSML